jgi:hypothetical protein
MLIPNKHLDLSESILGLSGFILKFIDQSALIDDIWFKFKAAQKKGEYPVYRSFDHIILALDFLYLIGAITIDERGKLTRVKIN